MKNINSKLADGKESCRSYRVISGDKKNIKSGVCMKKLCNCESPKNGMCARQERDTPNKTTHLHPLFATYQVNILLYHYVPTKSATFLMACEVRIPRNPL